MSPYLVGKLVYPKNTVQGASDGRDFTSLKKRELALNFKYTSRPCTPSDGRNGDHRNARMFVDGLGVYVDVNLH